MTELGITNYNGYTTKFTSQGNFLMFKDIFISPILKSTYIKGDLNYFIPTSTKKILKQFNSDLNKNSFKLLEDLYLDFIH